LILPGKSVFRPVSAAACTAPETREKTNKADIRIQSSSFKVFIIAFLPR
jgi:hypothetical protein